MSMRLLLAFCVFIVVLWMTPVIIVGFPFVFTSSVKVARQFAMMGVLDVVSPLFTLFLRALLPLVGWQNATGWALVSAVTLAAALIPLWLSIRHVFNAALAWVAVVIFCLMPMHWQLALSTGSYPLALLCLFSGFALFLFFAPRHRFAAVAFLGLCYGLVLATHHAFITFLPWFIFIYAWERRREWQRGVGELIVCGACVYAGFVLPLLPTALRPGLSVPQRLSVFLPIEENLLPPSEVYGDAYAYTFLKKEFDEKLAREGQSASFFERRESEHFRINYQVGSFGFFRIALNSTWLFLNSLGSLFMQEVVGGAFLWLLILPGIFTLFRTHRRVLLGLLGLWLSMEIVLRFGLHYGRIHLMDVGWIAAILAGAGVLFIADHLRRSIRMPLHIIAGIIVLVVSFQLIQENRKLLAYEYARTTLPRARALAQVLEQLPADAVIARPLSEDLLVFTDRDSVLLHKDTIDVLAEKGKLADPFRHYGITHIIGYDPARTALIRKAVPSLKTVALPENPSMPITPLMKYLLNLIR